MPIVLNGTTGITTPTYNGNTTAEYLVPVTAFKNRIINGAMVIDQRNAGAAVTADGAYPVDRFTVDIGSSWAYSGQQDTSAPAGFSNSLKITTTTASGALSATEYNSVLQCIEGFNIADLNWGSANAKTVTLSFWTRSSVTGTHSGALTNSAINRSYPFIYTISAANTWEYKTITIAGDTTGTWLTNNDRGIIVWFSMGTGTTYSGTAGAWAGALYLAATGATGISNTLNATWYITGVQLEVGSTATSFDYRPYGTELALCQRYYYQVTGASGNNYEPFASGVADASTSADVVTQLPVTMRAVPTTSFAGTIFNYDGSAGPSLSSVATVFGGKTGVYLNLTTGSGLTVGRGVICYTSNATTNNFAFSAEL